MSRRTFLKSFVAMAGGLALPALARAQPDLTASKKLRHSSTAGFQNYNARTERKPRGIALLVGVKDISSGGSGSERDVDAMAKIISNAGRYDMKILKAKRATAPRILHSIDRAASTLNAGDIFVFYFSGHGAQINDKNGDEESGLDGTLSAYGGNIVDDELAQRWKRFKPGVRIVMLSDCCHSGTNCDFPPIAAQLIHFSACRDDQKSVGDPAGGAFTKALVDVWETAAGKFPGYKQLYEAIKVRLKEADMQQEPQMNFVGDVQNGFLNSGPFSI